VWIDGESLAEILKAKGLAKDYDGEGARPEWRGGIKSNGLGNLYKGRKISFSFVLLSTFFFTLFDPHINN
jgi:hypothetical protein